MGSHREEKVPTSAASHVQIQTKYDEVKMAPSHDYQQKRVTGGLYKQLQLDPVEPNPVLQYTGNKTLTFRVPPEIINLNHTELGFDVTMPAGAGAGAEGLFRFFRTGHITPIHSVVLNYNGVELCEYKEIPHYTKLTLPATTNMKDFLSNPRFDTTHPAGPAAARESGQYWAAANVENKTHVLIGANGGVAVARANLLANNNGTLVTASVDGTTQEFSANQVSPIQTFVRTGGPNAVLGLKCRIPLKTIPHSIFGIDKDVPLAKTLKVIINLSNGHDWGYETKTSIAAAGDNNTFIIDARPNYAEQRALTALPVLSNIHLYVAKEMDNDLRMAVERQRDTKGIAFPFPVVVTHDVDITAAASRSPTVPFSLSDGNRLRQVYVGVFNSGDVGLQRFQNYNHGELFYSSIQPTLNNTPLVDRALSVNSGDVYRHMQKLLKGSVVTNNKDYNQQPMFCTDFTGVGNLPEANKLSDHSGGLNLTSSDLNYGVNINTTRACKLRFFGVCEKMLKITPLGITLG